MRTLRGAVYSCSGKTPQVCKGARCSHEHGSWRPAFLFQFLSFVGQDCLTGYPPGLHISFAKQADNLFSVPQV